MARTSVPACAEGFWGLLSIHSFYSKHTAATAYRNRKAQQYGSWITIKKSKNQSI